MPNPNAAQRTGNGSRLTRDQIRTAVEKAHVPTLLLMVYQATDDPKWLEERYRPVRTKGLNIDVTGGLPEDVQDEVRDAAVDVVRDLQEGKRPALSVLTPERAVELATIYLGEDVDDRYGPLLSQEIQRRAATGDGAHETKPLDVPDGYRAIVIGAGIAGLVAMNYLNEMGLEYTVFERNPSVGGVWYENVYPGAGVDTPSHLYSFSFVENDWRRHFELRDDLHRYFEDTVEQLGADRIRYEHSVRSATWNEQDLRWEVQVEGPDGSVTTYTAEIVISAVGSLNEPRMPNIPGMDDYEGTQFHSSQWPRGIDLTGKRVSVVGAGASAMQICPEIAGAVDHLTIYQRSPQWVAPFDLFRESISDEQRTLLSAVPLYRSWYWVYLFWQFGDKVIESLRVDPNWPHPERSVNARNDAHREYFSRYIRDQLGDRTDLLEAVMPDYPPFGKRILLDNGWYKMLKRDNVTLVTHGVDRVTKRGLVDSAGEEQDADVIVWATGFHASHFLESVDVYGTEGVRLRDLWKEDDPEAYLGVSIPRFPNFFMLGGPHSFPGSGSFMYFMEVQMRYLRDLITQMLDLNVTAIDADSEATKRYNELVDEVHEKTVWTHSGFGTYYRNSRGRVVFVMPFLNVEYWEFTRRPDLENYTLRYADGTAVPGSSEPTGRRLPA